MTESIIKLTLKKSTKKVYKCLMMIWILHIKCHFEHFGQSAYSLNSSSYLIQCVTDSLCSILSDPTLYQYIVVGFLKIQSFCLRLAWFVFIWCYWQNLTTSSIQNNENQFPHVPLFVPPQTLQLFCERTTQLLIKLSL